MMYDVKYTSRFKKDYKRLKKRGWNMDKLLDAIDILRSGMEMPPEYKDHPLRGDYEGHRDCHIEPGMRMPFSPSSQCSLPSRHSMPKVSKPLSLRTFEVE